MATGSESEVFLFRRHPSTSSKQRWKGRVGSETNKDQEKKGGRGGGIRGRGRLKTAKSREISLQSVSDDGDLTSMLGKAFASDRFKCGDGKDRFHFTICRIVRLGQISAVFNLSQFCQWHFHQHLNWGPISSLSVHLWRKLWRQFSFSDRNMDMLWKDARLTVTPSLWVIQPRLRDCYTHVKYKISGIHALKFSQSLIGSCMKTKFKGCLLIRVVLQLSPKYFRYQKTCKTCGINLIRLIDRLKKAFILGMVW